MSCLALPEDLEQKKHRANDLPWKHHNFKVFQNMPHGRIADVLINTISVKKIVGLIIMKTAVTEQRYTFSVLKMRFWEIQCLANETANRLL